MDNTGKAHIIYTHLLTDGTITAMQNELDIYSDFIKCLRDEDFDKIASENIYLNAFYSPATNAVIKVSIPAKSKIVTFDVNLLKRYPKEERIAILLHEFGHAFNPSKKGEEAEFIADDFVIQRGYAKFLKTSLEKFKADFPDEFEKEITDKRITRIG